MAVPQLDGPASKLQAIQVNTFANLKRNPPKIHRRRSADSSG
jgi:hypothetical protein